MEIKVGEYVRTNQGYIAKLEDIDKEFMYFDNVIMCYYEKAKLLPINVEILDGTFLKAEDYITKHSFNIIDLIEKGDYINGYKVLDIDFKNEMICLLMPFDEENKSKYNIVWNTKYFIKSIVTKEMFQNIEYRVESN